MKIHIIILILFTLFAKQKSNLAYPINIDDIVEVVLERPDSKSNGKFAEIKILNTNEIVKLLQVLKKAKAVGPTKFLPDFYIYFKTKNDGNYRIKINKNIIKGYKNDYSYKIENLPFLTDF
jgi:hypothetical protein